MGRVFIISGISAYSVQPIFGNIVLDRKGEVDGLSIIDGRDIDTSTQELVDERLVVIGTHTSPTGIADLTIEYCY